ncbi:hypothetical protein [Marinomonas arenicola]|uniref:Phosphoribulokinase/uridine kinase domain-containing protein n=1 Tax=Marinomonas arenicola TaxID=569601 RepID=A0ABU9G7T3_9GAMM
MNRNPKLLNGWKHEVPDSLAGRLRFEVEQTLKSLYASDALVDQLGALYLPFSTWLSSKVKSANGPLVVGLGGPQGSGKTTFSRVVSRVLCKGFDIKSIVVSLDDLYRTRKDRLHYAQTMHPLFATRGVPGTHDIDMALMLFERLRTLKDGEIMKLPAFDKSLDDRKPVHLWSEVQGPVDVIFLEGWCVGASALGDGLDQPMNRLEKDKDQDGGWRSLINQHLQEGYKDLFANIDIMMWMEAPDYDVVYQWRNKQERMLEAHLHDIHGGVLDTLDIKVMSPEALKGFMQYYERLTRHLMATMSERSDVVFRLNHQQEVTGLRFPTEH